MKNNKGFAPIVLLIIMGVVLVAGGAYYIGGNSKVVTPAPILTENQQATFSPTSTEGTKYPEDGKFSGYITRAYDKDSKKYIDIDYFVTLTGKAAVLKDFDSYNDCFVKYSTPTKRATILAEISNLKDDSTFDDQFRLLENQNNGADCFPSFPNGIWLDSNENSKIRTFEVSLNTPIIAAYIRDEFGPYKLRMPEGSANEIPWDTFKNIIARAGYKIPFGVTVLENKVVEISEIYRP